MVEKIHISLRDNPVARWSALLLLSFAMFCSYIFMDILSPIKDLMESTRGWDSTAFGTYAGSETFLNVFIFSSFCRDHSRQDGSSFHGTVIRRCHAHRRKYKLICHYRSFQGSVFDTRFTTT